MPAPFVAPLPLIVLDLEDGSRISVQGASDGSDLHIGVAVDLQLRRYALERGVPIYGYAALVSTTSENTIERPSA
jgi:hydroxymethylglutaryl-CoA synthase